MDVRTIRYLGYFEPFITFVDIGGIEWTNIKSSFVRWAKKAKLIGYYDFEKHKAVKVSPQARKI